MIIDPYVYYELIIIIGLVQAYTLTLTSKLIFDKGNFRAIPTTYKNIKN